VAVVAAAVVVQIPVAQLVGVILPTNVPSAVPAAAQTPHGIYSELVAHWANLAHLPRYLCECNSGLAHTGVRSQRMQSPARALSSDQ
jgi:hypothetical protein